ncbi:hypothetical protein ABEY69_25390 [Priestia filamentosa]|uniref:hypothetical protein n=1 Tax=Priestia filamentosa TaxID=1402861 RepID=UPI003D2A7B83
MKKTVKVLLSTTLALGIFSTSSSFVNAQSITEETTTLTEINKVAQSSDSLTPIDVSELPEGTEFVNFDTVEDFEKAVAELDKENKENKDSILQTEVLPSTNSYSSASDRLFTTAAAKTGSARVSVLTKISLNPIKAAVQPTKITVDFTYSYTGSGTSKKFSKINKVSSYSLGFPSTWHQTTRTHSFYSSNKGVKMTLQGYHLLGVNIAGVPAGFRASDTYNFSYKL